MSRVCEFCGHTFSTKTNLNSHQRTAKFCLKIQGGTKISEKITHKYTCKICQRGFVYNKSFMAHVSICTSNDLVLQTKIEMLEKELAKTEKSLDQTQKAYQKLAHVPRTQNLILNFTEDEVRKIAGHLTIGHIIQGAKGYCRLGQEQKLFENRLLVTDRSRSVIKLKIPEMILDYEGIRLSEIFFNGISDPNSKLINSYLETVQNKINLLEIELRKNSAIECENNAKIRHIKHRTNDDLMEELEICYGKLRSFTTIKSQINDICQGFGADIKLRKDFIKHVIKAVGNSRTIPHQNIEILSTDHGPVGKLVDVDIEEIEGYRGVGADITAEL